jgi:hypothetical protein
MQDHRLTYLKVKQKHIGTEKNIIRHQELKWKEKARAAKERAAAEEAKKEKLLTVRDHYLNRVHGLYDHRINIVRPEARATNIAYGYLRGHSYSEVENNVIENNFRLAGFSPSYAKKKLWNRVFKIVSDFSDLDLETAEREVKAWRKEHPQYREMNWDDLV